MFKGQIHKGAHLMKTIKQIADEIGVTKAAVQKRISRTPLYTQLSPHMSIHGGTKYINEDGVNIVKSAFGCVVKGMDMGIDTMDMGIDMGIDTMDMGIDMGIDTMDMGIDRVDKLLAIVNEQQRTIQSQADSIRELTAALEHTTSSLKASQALHAGTMKKQLSDGTMSPIQPEQPIEPVKQGFFQRFFNR